MAFKIVTVGCLKLETWPEKIEADYATSHALFPFLMTQVGQCSHCRAMNSYEVAQCLECRQPLPWGGMVQKHTDQMNAARGAVQQLQAQVQQMQQSPAIPRIPIPTNAPFGGGTVPIPPPPPSYGEAPPRGIGGLLEGENRYRSFLAAIIGETGAELFEDVNDDRARIAGLLLAGFWNMCVVVAAWLILRNLAALVSTFLSGIMPPSIFGGSAPAPTFPFGGGSLGTPTTPQPFSLSFGAAVKITAVATFAWGVLVGLCALVRTIGRGDGSFSGDLLVGSMALVPGGVWLVASGLLGLGNYSFVAALSVFALSYGVVLLHRGLTTISGVASSVAAICIPLMLLLDGLALKVVVTRLVSP